MNKASNLFPSVSDTPVSTAKPSNIGARPFPASAISSSDNDQFGEDMTADTALGSQMDAFVGRHQVKPNLWITPKAFQKCAHALPSTDKLYYQYMKNRVPWSIHSTSEGLSFREPAVLLLSSEDLRDQTNHAHLLSLASAAKPGRPIILGGEHDKDLLLDSMNVWHAFRIIPEDSSGDVILDAANRAFDALQKEYALNLAIIEYREEARRLRYALKQLSAAKKKMIASERMAVIGRATHAVLEIVNQNLNRLQQLNAEIEDLMVHPELKSLQESAMEGFKSTRSLLREMSDFTANRKHSKLQKEPVNIADLVNRAVYFCQFDVTARNRHIDVVSHASPVVEIDRYRIFHVLVNLLRNAMQATSSGGRICIEISQPGSDEVSIEVSDDGCGLSTELQTRVFMPFFSTKGDHGLGLGLHMSRATITKHGGKITFNSEKDNGTRVRIMLPA